MMKKKQIKQFHPKSFFHNFVCVFFSTFSTLSIEITNNERQKEEVKLSNTQPSYNS